MHSFVLPKGDQKQYNQQYGDMYFLRLAKLKPFVESIAADEWEDFEVAGERAQRVERVLDVRQGQLCWVVGTVYMELPLKPNILADISKDHWVAAPTPHKTYQASTEDAAVMLEDESGRLKLTGAMLKTSLLVTGVIVAVLGTENVNGEFDVLDIHVADLPRQPQRWERDDSEISLQDGMVTGHDAASRKVVLISGLNVGSPKEAAMTVSLLSEYLLGEALGSEDQELAAKFSRLIIAGNSVSTDDIIVPPTDALDADGKKSTQKKYGYDSATYNPTPIASFDRFLSELLPSIPITLMPGADDPAGASLPQQPLHPAMLPRSRAYTFPSREHTEDQELNWFDSVTNPWDGDIEGWRLMGNSGQPVDDILKYIDVDGQDESSAESRLEVMESILRWRCGAPTAPDTLCKLEVRSKRLT